uniref:Uncharacterized protein n=1 Tax=Arundo donax TaxID=35708 RepID=A0A0A9B806_ARUDO
MKPFNFKRAKQTANAEFGSSAVEEGNAEALQSCIVSSNPPFGSELDGQIDATVQIGQHQ